MRKLTVLAALLLLLPAVSQASNLEDLLVEKGVITKSEARASMESGAAKVYWNGGTRLEFPDNGFDVKIGTLLQSEYRFTDNDEGMDNVSSFRVRRARLILSGNALHKEFSYKMQIDFVGSSVNGARTPTLLDGMITWHACDDFAITMGQFKAPISRQFLNSSGKLQFVDRSLASEYFQLGRHQGAAASMNLADGMANVVAGIWNGTTDGEGMNRSGQDTDHIGAVGLRLNPMGKMDVTTEGDVDWTEDMAVSMGAFYALGTGQNDVTGLGVEDADLSTFNFDINAKYQGFSFHGEYYWANYEPDVTTAAEYEPTGFYVQGGYFVKPKTLELALRYGYIDCDNGLAPGICAGNDNVNEVGAGVNYFWWKHHMKAQMGYTFQNEDAMGAGGSDTNTNLWMLQLTSYF